MNNKLRERLLKRITPYFEDEWHGEGYPVLAETMLDDLIQPEIDKTRQDTLKEVGEWLLKNQIGRMADGDGCLHFSIDGYDFDTLICGEMPNKETK